MLCGRDSVRVPAAGLDLSPPERSMPIEEILPDWPDGERLLLLGRPVFDPARGKALPTAIVERTSLTLGDRIAGPVVIVERETSTVVTSPFDVVMQGDGSLLLIRKEIVQ